MTYVGPPKHLRAFAEAAQRVLSLLHTARSDGQGGFAVFDFLIASGSERDDLTFIPFTSRPPAHRQNAHLLDDIARLEENASIIPPRESERSRLHEISAAIELRRKMKRRFGNVGAAELIEMHEPALLQEAYAEIDRLMERYESARIPTDVGAPAVVYRAWQRGLIDPRVFNGLVQFGGKDATLVNLVENMAHRLGMTAVLPGNGEGVLDGRRWRESPPDYFTLWTEYSLIHRLRYNDDTNNLVMVHYPLVVEKDCFLGFAYFITHYEEANTSHHENEYVRHRALLSALFEEPFKFVARENATRSISVDDDEHGVVVQAARVLYPCFEISDATAADESNSGAGRLHLADWTAFLPDNSLASAWLTQELRLLEATLRGTADAVAGVHEEEAIGAKAVQYQQRRMSESRPALIGYDSAVLWKAARSGINGDLYGIVQVDDGYVGFVGDIQGKGIFAVLAWEAYRNLLLSTFRVTSDVPKCLRLLHEKAREANLLHIDVAIAHLETKTGRCTFAKTGTTGAAVLRKTEYMSVTASHFGIIGAATTKLDAPIEPTTIELAEGDNVLLFTDGVTDAVNSDEEAFGSERLARHIRSMGGDAPGAVTAHVDYVLSEFVHGAPRIDDVTMLVIQRLRVPPA